MSRHLKNDEDQKKKKNYAIISKTQNTKRKRKNCAQWLEKMGVMLYFENEKK